MNIASLQREIAAYEGMATNLRTEYGSGWVLMFREQFVRMFGNFGDAARYAREHFQGEQVLIRHTDQHKESAPFVEISL